MSSAPVALIQCLAWEVPYAAGATIKEEKKKKKKKGGGFKPESFTVVPWVARNYQKLNDTGHR